MAQDSYPVPASALAALAAEQAKLPTAKQLLQQLALEASKVSAAQGQLALAPVVKLPTAAQTAAQLAAEKKALPSMDSVLKALTAEAAQLPDRSTLIPWATKGQGK